jgi:hypothetical protein
MEQRGVTDIMEVAFRDDDGRSDLGVSCCSVLDVVEVALGTTAAGAARECHGVARSASWRWLQGRQ